MPEHYNTVMRELLVADNKTELPEGEEWEAMIERIKVPGAIHEISSETYWYFLEVLPPRWMDHYGFAFAEGEEPLQLFWDRNKEHTTRCLTWDETKRLCEARRHSRRPS